MNNKPLEENIDELAADIKDFRSRSERWWKYNARRQNVLLVASIVFVLGATLSGVWGKSAAAATFSALGAAIIAAQNAFNFAEQTKLYGGAMTAADSCVYR
jgi:hypothetical protein